MLLVEQAKRAGEYGEFDGLACFFKSPSGVSEQDFGTQVSLLDAWAAGISAAWRPRVSDQHRDGKNRLNAADLPGGCDGVNDRMKGRHARTTFPSHEESPAMATRTRIRRLRPERLEPRTVLSAVPVGGQFLINEVLSPPEAATAVAFLADSGPNAGRFIAVWQSYGADGDGYGIVAQAFERDGTPVAGTTAVVVNQPLVGEPADAALGNQIAATVAGDGSGNVVIAWQGENRATGGYDVLYRLGSLTVSGLSFGTQAVASTATSGDQTAPSAAMDAAGNFTIAWQTPGASAADGIDIAYRRGTLANGLAGVDALAHVATAGDQVSPAMAMTGSGELAITWRGPDPSGSGEEGEEAGAIFLRGFKADGSAVADELRVNQGDYNDLGVPDVAFIDSGVAAVVWQVEGQQESGSDAFARRMLVNSAAGTVTPLATAGFGTDDFRLNTTTQGPQRAPSVGLDADGDLLAAWQAQHQDGFSWAIVGRRYDAGADTLGDEFLVNNGTQLGPQIAPDIAVSSEGRAVVAWIGPDVPESAEEGEGGHRPAIHARFLDDAGGVPDGGEVVLATYAGIEDSRAAAASDAAGNMVVVWQSWQGPGDGSDFGIYAKLFQANGLWIDFNKNGLDDDTLLVNTFTAGSQSHPTVAMDASGNFVVAWESARQDGSGRGVYARRYDASFQVWADATEFRVHEAVVGDQSAPAVASDGTGSFTVVWQGADADGTGIYRRRYAASGVPLEGDTAVNVATATNQVSPAIAMNDAGESVIVWVSGHNVDIDASDSEKSIFARWYGAGGTPLGSQEFLVNAYVKDAQESPAVGLAANGNFVVAWQSINQERNLEGVGSSWGVYARRFAVNKPAGTVVSPQPQEVRVNGTTDGPQRFAAVGMDDSGRFTIAWQSIRQDGSSWAAMARHYEADGTPSGAEAVVNAFTNGPQILPVIAQRGAGDFTVVWSGQGTGRIEGNWGQRYRFVRDDFNRGNFPSLGPEWIVRSGDFEVRSNVAVIESSQALAQLTSSNLVDVAVQGRITIGGGTKTTGGLIVRSNDARKPTYYWGGIRQQGDQFVAEIGRRVKGTWRSLATVALPAGQGLVRFEVIGDSQKLFFDDALVLATNDRTITAAGRIGIQGNMEAAFDDFTFAALRRAAARVPFRDRFMVTDGSQLSRFWVERSGNFTVQGYRVRARAGVNLATVNTAALQDVVGATTVNVAAGGSHAGVAARVSADGRKMYWGGLVNRSGVLSAEIWRIDGGTVRRLAATSIAGSTGVDYVVEFEVTGTTQRLRVNDTAVVETVNSNLRGAGFVGMRASAGAQLTRLRVS